MYLVFEITLTAGIPQVLITLYNSLFYIKQEHVSSNLVISLISFHFFFQEIEKH